MQLTSCDRPEVHIDEEFLRSAILHFRKKFTQANRNESSIRRAPKQFSLGCLKLLLFYPISTVRETFFVSNVNWQVVDIYQAIFQQKIFFSKYFLCCGADNNHHVQVLCDVQFDEKTALAKASLNVKTLFQKSRSFRKNAPLIPNLNT